VTLVPRWVLAVAAVGALVVLLPVVALVLRVDPQQLWPLLSSAASVDALLLSLRTSLAATAACVVLGVPMALVLARRRFPGQRMLRALVLLPLVLPPVVGGLALLYAFGRRGVFGPALETAGLQLAFTSAGVVVAQTFVALPFLVLSLEGALRALGGRYEEVAATLGASPSTVLRRVTLPLVLPALASGTVLSFARALGEFGATLTFAGSLQGVTRTLPLEIYLQREVDPDAAVALSLVLILVALVVVALAHRVAEPRLRRRPRRVRPVVASAAVPSPPAQKVELAASVASRSWEAQVRVAAGQTVAVVGPNGAGKSTLLGLLAGTVRGDGRVAIGGVDVARLPPHRRPVGLLHQDPLLLPHLTALDNVAFGPRSRGVARAEARSLALRWLGEADAAELADRMPAELSGGQAQRVAIARALAADPAVLLLDEPLASLDVEASLGIRAMLARVLVGRTALLVTHDVYDAHVLADRVVVLSRGHVAEEGAPAELFARPRSAFAARLAGLELLDGWVSGAGFEVGGVVLPIEAAAGLPRGSAPSDPAGGPGFGALDPAAVRLAASATSIDLAVTALEPRGDHVRVRLGALAADVRPADAALLAPGDVVPVTVPAGALTVYPQAAAVSVPPVE
jgi:molybdate transport system permease protein